MKHNPLKDGVISENSTGIGSVTPEMVKKRAEELAVMDDRRAREASKADRAEAKAELTGESEDETEAALEDAPESERWDAVGGSAGGKVATAPSEDEDEEGRSDNEKLVEEGMGEAEDDIKLQAAKNAAKRNL
ncbi:MAG TPA: hypothetical protein VH255_05365 [Verrucomicrobiae bacterium]|jgi:hypothetical protein|nr:hypothetical protein [Verrucomicrobiae bacterium]